MNVNIDKLIKLNDLATLSSRRKRIIVLEPDENQEINNENIIYDKIEWKIPEEIQELVEQLSQNSRFEQ